MDTLPNSPVDAITRDCIAVRVRLLNRMVTKIYDEALRPLGVKVSQLNILIVASKLGLARPAAICKILQLDLSTLSRNVERMRAKGWLEVVSDQDARAHPFRVTPQGQQLIEQATPAWERAQDKATALLGEQGVTFLQQLALSPEVNITGR